jgi:hypothetical protein
MIQFRRGSTETWNNLKEPLAMGQPGYDKNKHKIKVGDGETLWKKLPYAGGVDPEEVLNSEERAKERYKEDPENFTIITYGTEDPNEDTVGQLYLQHFDAEPEVDYIIEYGVSGIWTYRKWKSGDVDCWGTYKLSTAIAEPFAGNTLFCNNTTFIPVKYPTQIIFAEAPNETASLRSNGWTSWLASTKNNTEEQSAGYAIISAQVSEQSDYYITINIHGKCKN